MMLSFEEALKTLLNVAVPVQGVEVVDTVQAIGRVLSESVGSTIDVPSLDNSAMDGYAVRVCDVSADNVCLPVSQRVPAGSVPAPLQAGTAARIFTGAPIPSGADAVVMQERCTAEDENVIVMHRPKAGENIRRAGEDIRFGSVILPAGSILRGQELGLVASVGVARLNVFARLRVAVFFTGDELVMPGQPLRPGSIYNSNRYVLHGLLNNLGCVVTDFGIIPDDLNATRQALRQAAQENDLVVTCGGVSVGEEDHVKAAVQAEGALETWKVAIKPGKPLAFGKVGDTPFIGLPGNPVSSFVTFMCLAVPYIRRRQGVAQCVLQAITARADFDWGKGDSRREFLRVRRNAQGGLDLFPHQGSGVLTSCVWADGLIDNPPGATFKSGDWVSYLPFSY